jgi:hypothetical protein
MLPHHERHGHRVQATDPHAFPPLWKLCQLVFNTTGALHKEGIRRGGTHQPSHVRCSTTNKYVWLQNSAQHLYGVYLVLLGIAERGELPRTP